MALMDEADRKRFLDTLHRDEEFRAAVRRELLTEELLNLPQTVATLVDALAQQRQDFAALAQSVANYMERTITAIQEGFAAVRGEVSDLRTDMDAGFTVVNAKFDQVDAELQDIRDQLAS
jgi:septation ring formation regulator EzrA